MHSFLLKSLLELCEALLEAVLPAGVIAGLLKLSGDWWKRRKNETKKPIVTTR